MVEESKKDKLKKKITRKMSSCGDDEPTTDHFLEAETLM